ncbi:MAG TPA: acyltransferase [Bryobacteraceae bacterium]|nr:acyltransferase [Bryobacteraceae bacterium]
MPRHAPSVAAAEIDSPSAAPRPQAPVGRIRELDGIRGLAILLVLTLHYVVETARGRLVLLLGLSWSGVDLFFVLSGFLIGGILLDARDSNRYYQTFYLRRLYRIAPLYFTWFAIFAVGAYWVGPHSPAPLRDIFNRKVPLWSFPLFLQNIWFTLGNTYGSSWMNMSWSLAVEEQFYLVLPLLIRGFNRRSLARFIAAAVLAAPLLRIVLTHYGANGLASYMLLPCRADSLGCGVILALAYRHQTTWAWICAHRRYIYAGFLVLGVGLALWTLKRDLWLMQKIGFSWMAGFYSLLLLLVMAKPGRVERWVFRSAILVKLGTIAYALYLFHSGILHLYHFLFFGALPRTVDWPTLSVTLLALTTVVILAALSWRFLEKPLIQLGHTNYRY